MPDFVELWRYPTPMGTEHYIYFCVVCGAAGSFLCEECEQEADDIPEVAKYRRGMDIEEDCDGEPFGDFVTFPEKM